MPVPIFRAPMRPAPERCVERGVVGIDAADGERGARRLERFAAVADGAFVWTRETGGGYRLGRIAGPLRRDVSADLPHVRPAQWLDRPFGEDEVPPAVARTFARGGRNFQRTHDAAAERRTAELWAAHGA